MDIRTLNVEELTNQEIVALMQNLAEVGKKRGITKECVSKLEEASDRESKIMELCAKYLIEIGITPKLKGYYYLYEAVILNLNAGIMAKKGIAEVYNEVGKKFGKSIVSVERTMRYAVNLAWDPKLWNRVLGIKTRVIPSNTQMIFMLCEVIRPKC